MGKIYKLIDPLTLRVRYVGFTTQTLKKRLRGHISERGGKTRKEHWVRSLRKKGYKPIIKLIRLVGSDWEKWEKFYIKKYRAKEETLINIADGGEGAFINGKFVWLNRKHTKATKDKMSKSRKESITQEMRETISKSNSKRLGSLNPRSIKVRGINIKTGKNREFVNMREAQKVLEKEGIRISRSTISKCIHGKKSHRSKNIVKSAGGHRWEKVGIK